MFLRIKIVLILLLGLCCNFSIAQCPPTSAAFTLNPSSGCSLPHTVFFTDQSNLPDTWDWDFGDGNTSTLQNPVHSYVTMGTFVVTLIVSDTIFGCRDTITDIVRVSIPNADFNGASLFGCAPITTNFSDASSVNGNVPIVSWNWNFGDGNTSTLQNPTHVYSSPGIYTVSLTVTDSLGCTNTETKNNYVQVIGPNVKFGPDTITGFCPGTSVNFIDSTIFGSPVINWNWNFGDGGTSALQNPMYTYNNQGLFDVTLIVTDLDGCRDTFVINNLVNIYDTVAPVFSCPANQSEFLDANCQFTIPDYASSISVTDDCTNPVVLSQNPTAGTVVNANQTITIIGDDGNGNIDSCSFSLILSDTTSPTITCPADQNVFYDANCLFTLPDYTSIAVANDNCSPVSVTQFPGASTIISSTTFVTLTATDSSGNTSNCTFNVIPSDTTSPTITCPADQNVFYDANCLFAIPDYSSMAVVNDNCGITNVTQFPGASTIISSTTPITLTVTDGSGNSSSCTFNVTPSDSTAPTITCPSNQTEIVDNNCQYTLSDYTTLAVVNDNCGVDSVTQSPAAGTIMTGTNTVTINVVDINGNTNSCTFSVSEMDTISPVINCFSDITSCEQVVTFATPSATDNCNNVNVIQVTGPSSGSSFPIGVTVVTFVATDSAGNTDSCSFNVEVLSKPTTTDVVTDVTCNGLSDGSIDITVSNGTLPYNFSWSNAATTEDINGLIAGTYTVIVTDSNNCSDTLDVIVNEPQPITINEVVSNISCYGASDGSVITNVSGGTSPYNYVWSNSTNGTSITGLSAGSYSLTVTDSNNCSVSGSYTIIEPAELSVSYVVSQYGNYNVSGIGACDGSIDLTITGGTAPFNYNWNSGHTGQNLSNLCAGTYIVDITDASGCTVTLNIVVTEPPPLNIPSGFSPNGDGFNDVFFIEGLDFYEENTLIIFNRWGNITFKASPYENDWDGTSSKSLIGKKAPDGSYFYKLKLPGGDTRTGYVILKR